MTTTAPIDKQEARAHLEELRGWSIQQFSRTNPGVVLGRLIEENEKLGNPFDKQELMKLAHEEEYQYGHDTLLKWVDEWMQDGTGQVKQERTEQFGTITAAELEEMAFAPVRWAVPDILPEGLTLFAGKQKLGKSWLALGLCVSVASGRVALGTRSVEKGDVLYLDLEGNRRRIKSRLKDIGAFPRTFT
jgi:RecA-family ATPase